MRLTMRMSALVGAFAVVIAAAWAAEDYTPLNIKPGYWETTVTSARSGAPPIPPELLARMTPEQQARLAERMKAEAAKGPQTRVTKSCLTKEDLAKSFGGDDMARTCKRTFLSSSGSVQDFKLDCSNQMITSTGTGHVEALDSEHVTGKTKMSISSGGQTMTAESTFTSKWLGAACPDKAGKK